MVRVSVIVPIYNVANYLSKCIDSILCQTYSNFELILINDGSTDESGRICEKYRTMDKRVKVLHTINRGTGEARNLGLEQAQGEFIYFCDPDDWIEPNLLEENIKLIVEKNADVVFFGYNYYTYNTINEGYIYVGSKNFEAEFELSFRDQFPNIYRSGLATAVWNKIYRLSFLKRNNCRFPSYSQGQDWSFNMKVYKTIDKVSYNVNCYYNYVKYNNNTAVTKYNKEKPYIRERLFGEFKSLLDHWKIAEPTYSELLQRCLLNEVLSELRNNFHFDSPDNLFVKYKKSKKLLHNEQIVKILGKVDRKTTKDINSMMILFIKKKFVLGIMLEAYARQIFRLKLKGPFYEIKNRLIKK